VNSLPFHSSDRGRCRRQRGESGDGGDNRGSQKSASPGCAANDNNSDITNAATISLRAYFTSANWLLNKAIPKGIDFLDSTLGNIMSEFHLVRSQVCDNCSITERRSINITN
jgi:hypothetical protein